MTTTENTNLRDTKREAAAARKTAAKRAPAMAPAKKAAEKAAPKAATAKVAWTPRGERDGKAVTGTCQGHSWSITVEGREGTVTHTSPTGKETVLTPEPVGYGAAYRLVVDAAKGLA